MLRLIMRFAVLHCPSIHEEPAGRPWDDAVFDDLSADCEED